MSSDARAAEPQLQPGELRFARDPSGASLPSGVHARLVLVLDSVGPDVVLALLVTEDVHIAGSADLLLGRTETGLDLQLCVQTDLAVSLAVAQLGPVVAALSRTVLDVVAQAFANGAIPDGGAADHLPRGLPLGSPADPRWDMKLAELADVQQLARTVGGRTDIERTDDNSREEMREPEAAAGPVLSFPADAERALSLWQCEIAEGSKLAGAFRSAGAEGAAAADDTLAAHVFTLDEQVVVELAGRPRFEYEALPTLRVRIQSDPIRLQVWLTVPGGLTDAVYGIAVVAATAAGEVRIPLALDDRDDPVFHGETPWPDVGPVEALTLRVEVIRS